LDEKTARCEAGGFPDFLEFDNPLDILQRPDELLMVTERDRQLPRHIYISPPHPISDEYSPARNGVFTHNGHSLAHWEGNTLVIKTDGFDPSPWMFSIDRIPHSDAMTTLERLSLSADTKCYDRPPRDHRSEDSHGGLEAEVHLAPGASGHRSTRVYVRNRR
jgi:hypothetical protein